jgi:hypothetical protein
MSLAVSCRLQKAEAEATIETAAAQTKSFENMQNLDETFDCEKVPYRFGKFGFKIRIIVSPE